MIDESHSPRTALRAVSTRAGLRPAGTAVRAASERYARRLTVATVAADALAILAAVAAAQLVRFGAADFGGRAGELVLIAAAPALWIGVFAAFRTYATGSVTPEEELRRVFTAWVVGMAALVMASYWSKAEFSRIWLALTGAFAITLEVMLRMGIRSIRARLIASGRIAVPTFVVGTNSEARALAAALQEGLHGYTPVGFVAEGPGGPSQVDGLPVVAWVGALDLAADQMRSACLFVAASAIGTDDLCRVARVVRRSGAEMMVTSRLPEVLSTRLSVRRVGSTTAMAVDPPRLTRSQAAIKRLADILVAAAGLIIVLPAMALIALAVRIDSPGPVLFRQRRVTRGGREFSMLKFRSMVDGAGRRHSGNVAPFSKTARDGDLTRVGRVIRRWSLDELPQLLNVICGEMSLVGPRPLPVEQVEAHPDLLSARHEVRSGMTGWWQVRGRSRLEAADAVKLDQFYVENWSLAYDLYILACTVSAVVRRRGAW